jgi:hypothetical protein
MAAWVLQIDILEMYWPQDALTAELRGERQIFISRGNA